MAEKSDSKIDLDEIRRMIGGEDTKPDQEFSLEDIINEVKDDQKKRKIKQKKIEEEENPFLSLVRETEELDASSDQKKDIPESCGKDLRQASALSFSETEDKVPIHANYDAKNVFPPKPETAAIEENMIKSSARSRIPDKDETAAQSPASMPRAESSASRKPKDEPDGTGKAPQKRLPLDFDETEFETAEEAVNYYKKREISLNIRAFFTLLVAFCSIYLTLAPTFAFPLPLNFSYVEMPYLYLFALIALEVGCMLIALDLTSAGMMRLFSGRPTIYSLMMLSALATLLHSISIIVFPRWGGYLPFSSLSCVLIFFYTAVGGAKKKLALAKHQGGDFVLRADDH